MREQTACGHATAANRKLSDANAVHAPQGMIAGLCESYGSVISLATYVHVLTEDLDKADSIIGRATAEVRAEFERCRLAWRAARHCIAALLTAQLSGLSSRKPTAC